MRPKVKAARRKASKLHGATAGYVSIVDRGANETPFTLIKSKNGATAMPVKKRGKSKAAKSHKLISTGRKQEEKSFRTETVMAKMVFSADIFESEDEVREWITEAEWEAETVEVTKNADGDWEARANGMTDAEFERLGQVEVEEEGVSAFVGERKIFEDADDEETDEADEEADTETKSEDDDPEDDEEETDEEADEEDESDDETIEFADDDEKDDEEKMGNKKKPKYSKKAEFLAKRKDAKTKVSKFDAWDAAFSDSNTLIAVIKDATTFDGTPPGFNEVTYAFNVAMGNILKSDGMPDEDRTAALQKAAGDYAEIIDGLDRYFASYIEMDASEVEKHVKDAGQREKLSKWAEMFADWLNEADPEKKDDEEEISDEDKDKTSEKKSESHTLTIDYNKLGSTVAELVAKAVEPLAKEVETVSGTVEALASRRPTKKAVASDDSGTAAPINAKKSATEETAEFLHKKQVKGIFG